MSWLKYFVLLFPTDASYTIFSKDVLKLQRSGITKANKRWSSYGLDDTYMNFKSKEIKFKGIKPTKLLMNERSYQESHWNYVDKNKMLPISFCRINPPGTETEIFRDDY